MVVLRSACLLTIVRFLFLQSCSKDDYLDRPAELYLGMLHVQVFMFAYVAEVALSMAGVGPTLGRSWSLHDVLVHHVPTIAMAFAAEYTLVSGKNQLDDMVYRRYRWELITVNGCWMLTATAMEIPRTLQCIAQQLIPDDLQKDFFGWSKDPKSKTIYCSEEQAFLVLDVAAFVLGSLDVLWGGREPPHLPFAIAYTWASFSALHAQVGRLRKSSIEQGKKGKGKGKGKGRSNRSKSRDVPLPLAKCAATAKCRVQQQEPRAVLLLYAEVATACDVLATTGGLIDMCLTGPSCLLVLIYTCYWSQVCAPAVLLAAAATFMGTLYPSWVQGSFLRLGSYFRGERGKLSMALCSHFALSGMLAASWSFWVATGCGVFEVPGK
jgi:hypothetical protein